MFSFIEKDIENNLTKDNFSHLIWMIDSLDIRKMEEVFSEDLIYEDKTASFIWSKDQAIDFYTKRQLAGVHHNRRLIVDNVYEINTNVCNLHGRWIGEIKGKRKEINFSTTIIMREGKVFKWADHYDLPKFYN